MLTFVGLDIHILQTHQKIIFKVQPLDGAKQLIQFTM